MPISLSLCVCVCVCVSVFVDILFSLEHSKHLQQYDSKVSQRCSKGVSRVF